MHHTANEAQQKRRELVSFRLKAQEFCFDIMSVREIRSWTETTPLPHAPSFIRGVINLRGIVLPVIDLAARLGFAPTEPTVRSAIIVAEIGSQPAGLLVDSVSDILTLNDDALQPTPDMATDLSKSYVLGLFALEDRMISLISLDNLLPTETLLAA